MTSEERPSRTSPVPDHRLIDDIQPIVLFQGYDTFTNEGRSITVTGTFQDSGATASLSYQVCFNFASLQQALQVSSSVNASFGFGDMGGKAEFIQKLGITNTTVTIVVYTNSAKSQTVTNVTLIGDPPSDINEFYQEFGDSFVANLVTGGEYGAVYVFYAETIDQQNEISATLSANGISTSGTLDAELQTSIIQVQQQISTRQEFNSFLNGYSNLAALGGNQAKQANQAIQFAMNLGSIPPDDPIVISYGVEGYEHVQGMPASFSSVVKTRNLYNGFGQQDGLADKYAQLSAVLNAISALQDIYAVYGYTGDVTLTQNAATIQADIRQLGVLFQAMATDPTQTYTAPVLPGLTLGTPSLNVTIDFVPPFGEPEFGGPGGSPFNHVAPGSVSNSLRLTSFSVRGGAWVDQIAGTYVSDAGPLSFLQGGFGGVPSLPISLEDNERVASVAGQYGVFVAALTLTTTNNRVFPLWPPAGDGGTPFSWSAQGTTAFLGFAGRSGLFLDQLQIVTATFSEAQWEPYTGEETFLQVAVDTPEEPNLDRT